MHNRRTPAASTSTPVLSSSSSRPPHSTSSKAHLETPSPSLHTARQVHFGATQMYPQSYSPGSRTDEDAGDEEDEEDEDASEAGRGWNGLQEGVTLAVTAVKGRVACCCYDGRDGKLYFLEDQEDSTSWDLAAMVIEQTAPQFTLTSASADSSFLAILVEALSTVPPSSSGASSQSDPEQVKLEYRPPREFYASAGGSALAGLRILESGLWEDESSSRGSSSSRKRKRNGGESEGDEARRNGQLRLESFVGGLQSCPLALGCAASLLGHLARLASAAGELEVEDAGLEVAGLEVMRLDKVMHINREAMVSLQIFHDESHASLHSEKTKEGLSLFGILNIARTPMGRTLMRQWFLRPTIELDVISSRQDAVDCFVRPENDHIVTTLQNQLRSIKQVNKSMRLLANGRGVLKEWQDIWRFVYTAIMTADAVRGLTHRSGIPILGKLLTCFDREVFNELGETINDVVDWQESTLQKGRIIVKSGLDANLDELRRTYHGLPSLLTSVADQISVGIPPAFATNLSVVYFPQLGYLITVANHDGVLNPEDFHVEGWEYQFVTEENAYFKDPKTRDMDKHIGDLYSYITDKEIEIVHALLVKLLKESGQIKKACGTLAELDCLLAFAQAAKIYGWNRPKMTDEPICKILQGRHPLVELCVDSFVPNDASLVGGRGVGWNGSSNGQMDEEEDEDCIDTDLSMLIITGTNYSGKSICLKQLALLTFMAHLGSFIPVEAAIIGLTDRIITRISTRESITRGSSAFMIDLQQISFALRNSTARSLVVIDEFGKGTESADGAGLFCGVVEHLIHRGSDAPRVVIATHFQDLFANGLLSTKLPVGLAHMEVLLQPPSTDAPNEITYLYRLAAGLATSSSATACAARFGLSTKIIDRANEVTDLLSRFELASLLNASLSPEERKDLEECEGVGRRFLKWELEGVEDWGMDELGRRLGEVLGIDDGDNGE